MALGVRDLKDLALPAGWDGAYLARQALKDGTTYETIVNELAGAVVAFNNGISAHPWLAMLTSPTTSDTVRYRQGASDAWGQHTEYRMPDADRAAITGHMIPRVKFDKGLGWTWDYMNEAILDDVAEDIMVFSETGLDLFEREAVQRLFRTEDVTVGASGISPGPANGTGVSSLTFTPKDHAGESFASTHSHTLRYASTAEGQAAGDMAAHLFEHGHQPPYEMFISEADKVTWAAVSDATNEVYFRNIQRTDFAYSVDETRAAASISADEYLGLLDTPSGAVYLRALQRIPTAYSAMFKPYGINDVRNPLRWRFNPRFGQGISLISGDKLGFPAQSIVGYAEFGFAYGRDRTNAVLLEIDAAGNYATPTIT